MIGFVTWPPSNKKLPSDKASHACENMRTFLNQACAWFLEIAFVREVSMRACVRVCVCVCVCVYVSAPKAMNN